MLEKYFLTIIVDVEINILSNIFYKFFLIFFPPLLDFHLLESQRFSPIEDIICLELQRQKEKKLLGPE